MNVDDAIASTGRLNVTTDPIPCAAIVVHEGDVSASSVVANVKAVAAQVDRAPESTDEVIILDITPTEEEGAELIRQIQQSGQMPIIVLSSGKRTEGLKLAGEMEPQARLRVVRCRMVGATPANNASIFQCADLRVDLVRRFVTVRGEPIRLSKNEFRLLSAFVRNAGKTLTGRQLLEESFGPDTTKTEHYLRMYIMLLRRRIERNAGKPRYILTDRNRGYRLASPQQVGFAMKRPA
jgi:two-component system KDP operon response regulator KdpE